MSDAYTFNVTVENDEREFSFLPETHLIRQQCKLAYTQAYAFYFKNGTMTRAQALDIAKKNGVIDDEWSKRVDLIVMQITNDTALLKKEKEKKRPNKKKQSEWIERIRKNREKYEELLTRQTEVILPTCENLAENREIEMSVVLRLVDVEGRRVYKDHADLVSRYEEPLTNVAVEHMMYYRSGLPYQLNGIYPEGEPQEKEPAEKKSKKE